MIDGKIYSAETSWWKFLPSEFDLRDSRSGALSAFAEPKISANFAMI